MSILLLIAVVLVMGFSAGVAVARFHDANREVDRIVRVVQSGDLTRLSHKYCSAPHHLPIVIKGQLE